MHKETYQPLPPLDEEAKHVPSIHYSNVRTKSDTFSILYSSLDST